MSYPTLRLRTSGIGDNMAVQALIKGWTGELKTRIAQGFLLDIGVYHTFNNILVGTANHSTQIDHVIVSKYGLFVVETKNHSGWIYGSQNQKEWSEVFSYGRKKVRFQNPLRQNYRHTKALAEFLAIDHSKLHSVVVFWGDCEFKTEMPENVVHGTHTGYIKSKNQVLLSEDEVTAICDKLKALKDSTPFLAGWHHTRDLKRRFDSTTTCPRCGAALVQRRSRISKGTAEPFLGCVNFPRCRYTKQV